MKIGDLVAHRPSKSTTPALVKIYEDWGHTPDFKAGIVIQKRDNFFWVLPARPNTKPAWYQFEELEVLSESR